MSDDGRPEINMSRIRISGIGGLGMVAIAGVMAYALPEARGFVLGSLAGGCIMGILYIAYRRWVVPEPPHGPTLMVATSSQPDTRPQADRDTHTIKLGTAMTNVWRRRAADFPQDL